jgi:hypothetical protein
MRVKYQSKRSPDGASRGAADLAAVSARYLRRLAPKSSASTSAVPWTSTIGGLSMPLPVASEKSSATRGSARASSAFRGIPSAVVTASEPRV